MEKRYLSCLMLISGAQKNAIQIETSCWMKKKIAKRCKNVVTPYSTWTRELSLENKYTKVRAFVFSRFYSENILFQKPVANKQCSTILFDRYFLSRFWEKWKTLLFFLWLWIPYGAMLFEDSFLWKHWGSNIKNRWEYGCGWLLSQKWKRSTWDVGRVHEPRSKFNFCIPVKG